MLHYYLERGITAEHILSLSPLEREFYIASMELTADEIEEAAKNNGKAVT